MQMHCSTHLYRLCDNRHYDQDLHQRSLNFLNSRLHSKEGLPVHLLKNGWKKVKHHKYHSQKPTQWHFHNLANEIQIHLFQ